MQMTELIVNPGHWAAPEAAREWETNPEHAQVLQSRHEHGWTATWLAEAARQRLGIGHPPHGHYSPWEIGMFWERLEGRTPELEMMMTHAALSFPPRDVSKGDGGCSPSAFREWPDWLKPIVVAIDPRFAASMWTLPQGEARWEKWRKSV